jgi:hypothetical protein
MANKPIFQHLSELPQGQPRQHSWRVRQREVDVGCGCASTGAGSRVGSWAGSSCACQTCGAAGRGAGAGFADRLPVTATASAMPARPPTSAQARRGLRTRRVTPNTLFAVPRPRLRSSESKRPASDPWCGTCRAQVILVPTDQDDCKHDDDEIAECSQAHPQRGVCRMRHPQIGRQPDDERQD